MGKLELNITSISQPTCSEYAPTTFIIPSISSFLTSLTFNTALLYSSLRTIPMPISHPHLNPAPMLLSRLPSHLAHGHCRSTFLLSIALTIFAFPVKVLKFQLSPAHSWQCLPTASGHVSCARQCGFCRHVPGQQCWVFLIHLVWSFDRWTALDLVQVFRLMALLKQSSFSRTWDRHQDSSIWNQK